MREGGREGGREGLELRGDAGHQKSTGREIESRRGDVWNGMEK